MRARVAARQIPKPPAYSRDTKEKWQFELIGRKLDREARELREELYVTAVYGVRTSWTAVQRASIYFCWRSRRSLKTRQYNSVRPVWPGRLREPAKVIPFAVPVRRARRVWFVPADEKAA